MASSGASTLATHVDNINRWFFNNSESADSGAGSSPSSEEQQRYVEERPNNEEHTKDDSGAESDCADAQDVRRQAWQTTMHRFFNHTDYDYPQKYTGSMGSSDRGFSLDRDNKENQQRPCAVSVIVSDSRPNRSGSNSSGTVSPVASSTSNDSGNECSEKENSNPPNTIMVEVLGVKREISEKTDESQPPSKKTKKQTPDESKDEAYWERRRKNNQAAKKSRDIRRQKEMHVLQRHKELEDTNDDLRKTVNSLKEKNDLLQDTLHTYRTLLIKHGFDLP